MSSEDVKNGEDSDMAECDGENVVTMMDVLKEQQDFEDDANAVLGASDDKNCTYSKGYVKRQAIYACMTCCPEAKTDPMKRAGVCLACSLHCHENHELVELYTKRNFRCDCGNPKFNQPCHFTPNKMDLNYENRYNQNFCGVYCICHRPYPDPENTEEDEMIQCVVCEDWLHINHLNATVPHNDQYEEMVCQDCMEDNDFLHDYTDIVINVVDKEIIITDPDLDINESYLKKDNLVNGNTNEKDGADNVSDNLDGTKEPEPKNDMLASSDDTKEVSADVDMQEEPKIEEKNESSEKTEENVSEKTEENVSEKTEENVSEKTEENVSEKPSEETNAPTEPNKDQSEADANTGDTESKVPENATEAGDKEQKQDDAAVTEQSENETQENKSDEKVPEQETKPEEIDEKMKEQIEEDKLLNDEPDKQDTVEKKIEAESTEKEVSETVTTEETKNSSDEVDPSDKEVPKEAEAVVNGNENKRKFSTDEIESPTAKKTKLETRKCIRPRGVKRLYKGATFWPSDFRQKLCTCNECISMYKDLAVLFLTDLDDTVSAYEALGQERTGGPSSQYEKGLQALSSLDRVQQINALTEYNKMKDKLLDFLKSFKDKKEIVKEEDIKAFFAGMKPKREPDGVYFCR